MTPSPATDHQELRLGAYAQHVASRLEEWQAAGVCRRIWQKDPSVWSSEPVPELADRMGWLDLPRTMMGQLDELQELGVGMQHEGVEHVVLLGMGGSSLAPEVFSATFGSPAGRPQLVVLDSTHPGAVRAVIDRIDAARTLVVVSSKSGTTVETLSLFYTFWDLLVGTGVSPGRHFLAITDPGTPLEELAGSRGFRRVVSAPPDVGGRFSALSVFGLVPAALIGVDLHRLLDGARALAESSSRCRREPRDPSLLLGAALGELASHGRDKLTVMTSPGLAAFPAWLEQLVAESTGKIGKGIVPVCDERRAPVHAYSADRVFVVLTLDGDSDGGAARRARALESAGHPVIQIRLEEKAGLGRELFRWELAVAAASAVLGINPFDQPDVQLAKELAKRAMATGSPAGRGVADAVPATDAGALGEALDGWARVQAGDYVCIQAYLAPDPGTVAALDDLRAALGDRLSVATTLGVGPRFLHSTGQLHKGGPNTGLFLQLVDEPSRDIAVPETNYTFAALIAAQAEGDYRALVQRGRRVLRVNLGRDPHAGLASVREAVG